MQREHNVTNIGHLFSHPHRTQHQYQRRQLSVTLQLEQSGCMKNGAYLAVAGGHADGRRVGDASTRHATGRQWRMESTCIVSQKGQHGGNSERLHVGFAMGAVMVSLPDVQVLMRAAVLTKPDCRLW